MSTASSFSDAEWAQQLAAERARREQAEAEVAELRARLAAREQPPAAPFQALHTQVGALVHNLRLGVVLVDGTGAIQYVSPHFWRLFGLEPVAGPPFSEAQLAIGTAFADPEAFHTRAWALHTAGKTVLGEAFLLRDGRRLVLDYLVLDEAGAGRLICYRDVSRAHRREQRQRLLAAVPEQSPNPILRLAPDGELLYANPAAAPLVEALRAAPAEVLPPLLALAQAAQQAPGPRELAVAGQYYLATAAPVPGQAATTLYFSNINDRRLAEEWLGRQRVFYESVLEQVPTAVAVFDDEHRYLFLNAAIEPDPALRAWMLGKTSTEACARRQRPPAVAQQRAAAFAEVMRTGREVQWEESFPAADGTERHAMLWYRPVQGLAGTRLVISLAIDLTERKRAEQQVVQQQEFYESILNLVPFDVAVFDAEHRFRFVNPASVSDPEVRRQIIGLTNAEYFALRQAKHPEIGLQRDQYFDLAVRTRTDVTWEETRTDRRGRPQLMVRHLRPVFGPDGALRLVVGSGIDITARFVAENLQHKVQEMLREQEAFIRQIVDALPNVLYLVEPKGGISFSNRSFNERIMASTHLATELQSETVAREVADMRAFNQDVLDSGQAEIREMPLTLRTGEQLYYQVYKQPLRRANGQLGVLTISTDITEVKRARQALERREKQYHDLVHYSQALICTHDLQGTILTVNPAIEQLMGVPAAELVGRDLRELLPPEHRAIVQAYLDGDEASLPQPRVISVLTHAGERRYLNYYTYRVTEEGYPPYVVASGYDVTAGVLAQRALRQAKQEAEDNAHAKETFLARMSHEIRTPLNGVLGMATLLHKTPLSGQQTEYLNAMQLAGNHLLSLLNDVLDMAKIAAHHLQLNVVPFDLAELLRGVGQTVAALAAAQGLTLEVRTLPGGPHRVAGDAYRLHQILLNLLANAIKFTEQGRVELGAEVLAETPEALHLRFWVADTGIGIAPAEQGHIFEAFAQASADTSRRFGGTGLGLAISQQLVEQMGGTLALRSAPGQGSTFSFELHLPRAAGAVVAAGSNLAEAQPTFERLRGLRVLLAEDNYLNQWIARVVLEHWGVEVEAVSNGTDALAQLSAHDFDAAILDIRMPGLSGVEVTTALRALPDAARAGIPIIALTANAFETDREAYLAAGMNACLVKPYEEADLCQLLLDLTAD
ncbi:PAS domain S-box protein [Hymenobacter sp. DH14]|uniref:histidine kinase n=1 Tax=Hymenobacter cyanobacteriorum TaxID=2926463 RepID=A0A9X1VBX3_9BACT|nr:PAS domain S-box protein [Hymenobacter cyanobacteriorum]MCI1186224.1 PAS domain S-box protein [Hymenobacter cyanobacteriorum]